MTGEAGCLFVTGSRRSLSQGEGCVCGGAGGWFGHLSCLVFCEIYGSVIWSLTLILGCSQSFLLHICLLFLSLSLFSFWQSHNTHVIPYGPTVLRYSVPFFFPVFFLCAFPFCKFLLTYVQAQTISSAVSLHSTNGSSNGIPHVCYSDLDL